MQPNKSVHPEMGVKVWDQWNGQLHSTDQAVELFYRTDTDCWFLVLGSIAAPIRRDDMLRLHAAMGWTL